MEGSSLGSHRAAVVEQNVGVSIGSVCLCFIGKVFDPHTAVCCESKRSSGWCRVSRDHKWEQKFLPGSCCYKFEFRGRDVGEAGARWSRSAGSLPVEPGLRAADRVSAARTSEMLNALGS